jgi:hypothetical protein
VKRKEKQNLRTAHLRRTIKYRRQGINEGQFKVEGTKPVRYAADPDGVLCGDVIVPRSPLSLVYYDDKGEFVDCVQDLFYLKNLYKILGTKLKKLGELP